MKHYHIEVTDLFCGEMNYSFLKRYKGTRTGLSLKKTN